MQNSQKLGAATRNRTPDIFITSEALFQLSYGGELVPLTFTGPSLAAWQPTKENIGRVVTTKTLEQSVALRFGDRLLRQASQR